MAEGDGVADQDSDRERDREIRIRLDRTAGERDVGALMAWLAREEPLEELLRANRLRIDEGQSSEPGPGVPMGVGSEIVVVLVGAAAGPVFSQLVQDIRRGVDAWRANRRDVEHGPSPGADVRVANPDDDG
ncbi:hypothetical protein [Streptomyces sp. NPDC101776]|uniref:hypothetical protein n=1 Tax=Streptomyces sp. NPDC101776 TaxID=3366146 RepID=UPI00382B323D